MGLGQWMPETVRTNDQWPPAFVDAARQRAGDRTMVSILAGEKGDHCDRIVGRHLAAEADDPFLGTTRRRVADERIASHVAESHAARAAIADAGIDARDIDVVISWELVPERVSLPSAPRVAHAVGATRAFAMGVEAGCASALAQLSVGAAMIASGQARFVLATQSHLIQRTLSMSHPASPNVGDLATAMLLGPETGHELLASRAQTQGEYAEAVVWSRGAMDDVPWYRAGDQFHMGSKDRESARFIMQNAVRIGVESVLELLAEHELSPGDLAGIISVQPRRWVPGAIAEVLGLAPERAPHTFDEVAHVGACGTVANLIAARERGLFAPGNLIGLYAQGAGFTRAAALLRW